MKIFQYYINNIFHDFLDKFLIIYFDNLFIYFKIMKKYKLYIQKILEYFCDMNLYLKFSKYLFHIQEIIFLDFIIDFDDIKMNSMKIEIIIF